ncbi:MAG: hypothetical protein A2Y15_02790 [Clostridiales bacterium GWF2_36_10]|nr:MAG: hypothetical protein A2Y15_02790 [Clostridiales bacterium GWF2_36_10]HAN21122.1 hypothetical protein [Clostridiales bacterium]
MSESERKRAKSFVTEAAILSLSGFAVKIIGLLFKIPLTNILGSSMSIFNAAYSIYAMLFMISTSGLPVAISRMVAASAEKGKLTEVKKILKMSIYAFGIVGVICSLFLFFFAEPLAVWSIHPDSVLAMRIISPTLFLICIASAYRGYFQGLRNMYPTAISQFIEAFIKLSVGLGATLWANSMGYSKAVQAAFAISGLTLGVFLGMLYMVLYKMFSKRKYITVKSSETMRYKLIAKRLVLIALPVTITSSALYLSQFLDTLLINKVLTGTGVTEKTADALYAAYTSLSISISDLLPSTLIYPIAVSILPAVAGALALRKRKKAIGYIVSSIRISGIIALPCSLCLIFLSRPAISLIYGASWGDPITLASGRVVMGIDIAAPALSILAIGIFFISLVSTTNALLQATGKVYYPMYSVGTGVLALIILEVGLLGIKPIGIFGAPISSVVCYIIALYMNLRFLRKTQKIKLPPKRLFLKPFICAAISGVYCFISYKIGYSLWTILFKNSNPDGRLASFVILLLTALGAVFLYIFLMLITKAITANEVRLLPKGRQLAGYFIRKGWLKDSNVMVEDE